MVLASIHRNAHPDRFGGLLHHERGAAARNPPARSL